jgi:hypothetical protein
MPPPAAQPQRTGLAVTAGLALLLAAGCLTALAPNIRARDHHRGVRPGARRGECLSCHELESAMTRRMAAMDPQHLEAHTAEMMASGAAPLVQDWMVRDRRDCLDCHQLRPRRATTGPTP